MSVKGDILLLLEQSRGESISGEKMAQILGVSRNSVCKAVRQLKEEGHQIRAVTNRGYCLAADNDVMSEAGIRAHLNGNKLVSSLLVLSETDSTNRVAKELAEQGAKEGTLVVANSQSAGRGRLGRSFYSPENSGIYTSMVLRPKLPLEKSVLITSCAAVAVARAIEQAAPVTAQIKWVNDVFLNGKKVCGILTEAGLDFESGSLQYAVVGIGINTRRMEFPKELENVATSVENESNSRVLRNELVAGVWNEFEVLYREIETAGFLPESRSRSILLGKEINVHTAGGVYAAKAVDLDALGHLIIERDGVREVLNSGEVSIRLQ